MVIYALNFKMAASAAIRYSQNEKKIGIVQKLLLAKSWFYWLEVFCVVSFRKKLENID